MMTVRQIERYWQLQAYDRLIDELCAGRAEATGGIRQLFRGSMAAAALAVIRLDELNQSYHPLVAKLIRFLLAGQSPDGGWGDAVLTALGLRALSRGAGTGVAVERALQCLKNLRRDDGEWPAEPFRRFEGDPAVTAFVLFELAEMRSPSARALIADTLDRLTSDFTGDAQLATLRKRVRARHSMDQALAETNGDWMLPVPARRPSKQVA